MELKHILTYEDEDIVIDEPIGYDDLQMTMQRHDYHGMGAEVSLGNLEFYGQAFDIIKEAYDTDIDSDVTYTILIDNNEVLYSGKVDLSTCSFLRGDYQSVKVRVGEVGTKTTFNNRVDVDIDLNDPKTVDGAAVNDVEWLNIHIPVKHLLYTNKAEQREDMTVPVTVNPYHYATTEYALNNVDVNEFGKFCDGGTLFFKDEDFDTKFGTGTETTVELEIEAEITQYSYVTYHAFTAPRVMELRLMQGSTILASAAFQLELPESANIGKKATLTYTGTVTTGTLNLMVYESEGEDQEDIVSANVQIAIKAKSSVKMTMYDTLVETEPVNADMILVHDTLNVVAHAISENDLAVKSDWYRTPESEWNAGSIGGGALKALTNGYHIRGLFTDDYNKRNMPVSFKALIESLDALDCIGWGFSNEDNLLCVRVERWDWFYKNATILTLTDVAEVTTDVDTDRIPTELAIGYKKYATSDEYNSIESPHGTRKFTSGIKAVTKAVTKECNFVADNYAIEETRRAKTQKKKNEETTYDENLFVFELKCRRPDIQPGVDPEPPVYAIAQSAANAENVGRASEFINAKMTPRHMAARWRDYIFATNNSTPFKFTSGEINYKASFSTRPEDFPGEVNTYYLTSSAITSPQVENADITYSHAKFKAEKITFSCPISLAQYRAVKANPYGLVSVNGRLGWIMNFKYKLQDGMADFTLIAKN